MSNKLLSIIITNYNKGHLVLDCLTSLTKLDDSVELIFIDDASEDESLKLIEEFVNENPNSIIIKNQKNVGVSTSRNIGINHASGEYVTFLDSDDYISTKILSDYLKLIKKNKYSMIIGNIQSFNEKSKWRISYLNNQVFKDHYTGVKTINENPELHLTPSVCNKIFKKDIILKNKIYFDEDIFVGEDLLFTQEFYLYSSKIFVDPRDYLFYRKGSNLTLSSSRKLEMINQIVKVEGAIYQLYSNSHLSSKYVEIRQFNYLYNLLKEVLKSEQQDILHQLAVMLKEFANSLHHSSLELEELTTEQKIFLEIISSEEIEKIIAVLEWEQKKKKTVYKVIHNQFYHYWAEPLESTNSYLKIDKIESFSKVERLSFENDKLLLHGYSYAKYVSNKDVISISFYLLDSKGNKSELKWDTEMRTDVSFVNGDNRIDYSQSGFNNLCIDLNQLIVGYKYKILLQKKFADGSELNSTLKLELAELRNQLRSLSFESKNISLSSHKELELIVEKNSFKNLVKKSIRFSKAYISMIRVSRKQQSTKNVLLVSIIFLLFKRYLRAQKTWLIGERKDTAQDNSYHLFKFINENKKYNKIYYVIEKKSKDYSKVKKLGNVIEYGSLKHTLYLLTSTKSINSYLESANMYTESYKLINKFFPTWSNRSKVFLQHGVIGFSRLNHVLHKNRANYKLFVASTTEEYNHLNEEYGYTKNEIVLSGLGRWDNLHILNSKNHNSKKSRILLIPTWRHWISSSSDLLASEYWRRFIELMTSVQFVDWLRSNNIEMCFYPHYLLKKYLLDDFKVESDVIKIMRGEEDIQSLLLTSDIMITDYSSISYDFAYMGKPVIYYQFDADKFYSEHYNKGPILEHSMPGVVVNSIDEILGVLKSGENKKVESVFPSYPHCSKIYEAILSMED